VQRLTSVRGGGVVRSGASIPRRHSLSAAPVRRVSAAGRRPEARPGIMPTLSRLSYRERALMSRAIAC